MGSRLYYGRTSAASKPISLVNVSLISAALQGSISSRRY